MKTIIQLIFLLLTFPMLVNGQITLEQCQQKARENYPMVKQFDLIEQTRQYNISNANKGYLPQVSVSVKATYQSDVSEIPPILSQMLSQMSGKEVSFPTLSNDQYQAVLEANQLIWDGGVISAQKKITEAGAEIDRKKLDVELFALNE